MTLHPYVKKNMPFLFADDTNLFISGRNLNEMVMELNNELTEISSWLKVNKLSLNIKKTHFMLFSSRRRTEDYQKICIDNNEIKEVEHTKFLGVYIDNKLNWKKHISYISGKISRGIGIILKARKVLDARSLKTLYFSFIYPFFTYCNYVWGYTYETNLKPLITLQKRCIRIISSAGYRDHTDPLFLKHGLLKLVDLNKYLIGKFMYKCYHKKVPAVFHGLFTSVLDVHNYGTRQRNNLYFTKVKTNLGMSGISYRGPLIWNRILKSGINLNTSESAFSKEVHKCILLGKI